MKNKTKMLSIVLAIVMILTSVSIGVPTFAASKPSATQITSIKAVDNGFKVKWKKKSCTGYQVQYSTSKKFAKKNTKTVKVKKAKTTKATVKKLKGKKKYYVRVRTYKTVKKKKYYSKWSANYSVTTKAKKGSSSRPNNSSVIAIRSVSYITGKNYGFKVTWNKVSGAQNYDVQCSFDKNFKHDVYRFSSNNGTTTTKSFTEIGENDDRDYYAEKTWYFRVRYYDKNFKAKPWSKVVSKFSYEMNDYQNLMNNAFNEMGIVSTDSDFDKVIKIQRWIDSHWKYGYANEEIQGNYALAKCGKGVCADFADAFNVFCEKANIKSYTVGGGDYNSLHSWNWVKIDGYWYSYDCESTYTNGRQMTTRFFPNDNTRQNNYNLSEDSLKLINSSNPKPTAEMVAEKFRAIRTILYNK